MGYFFVILGCYLSVMLWGWTKSTEILDSFGFFNTSVILIESVV